MSPTPSFTNMGTYAGSERGVLRKQWDAWFFPNPTIFSRFSEQRAKPLEVDEVGHRSSSIGQLGYIACQLGRKLTWDPAAERFQGDDEANKLLTRAMRAPWDVS